MLNIQKAIRLAKRAHKGQYRKYTGEPYIKHPLEVASLVTQNVFEVHENDIVAAILHDVVEDTDVTLQEILEEFGPIVAELVCGLTDVSVPEDGNRKTRKAIDRHHLAKTSAKCQMIKLCDLINNTSSIVEHDKDFAKVYLEEKSKMMKVMRPEVKQSKVYIKALIQLESCKVDLEHYYEKEKSKKV